MEEAILSLSAFREQVSISFPQLYNQLVRATITIVVFFMETILKTTTTCLNVESGMMDGA
jgi:hypothetical protein